MKNLYLIRTEGQNSLFLTLVTRGVWRWVMNPLTVKVPKDIIDGYYEHEECDGKKGWTPTISSTRGKPNDCTINDAALQVPGAKIDGAPWRAEFYNMKDCINFVREHNINIVDEWSGYIY